MEDYGPMDDGEEEEFEIDELELENLEEMELKGEGGGKSEPISQTTEASSLEEPPDIQDHAAKVYAMELVSGEFVRGAKSDRSFLRMWNGQDIEKAWIMGTIVQAFLSNDGNYCALTIDDGTETVRVKGWREDAEYMSSFSPGQIVDLMGQVREYNGEVYLAPRSINHISDPNWEPLRELEIYNLRGVKKNDLQL